MQITVARLKPTNRSTPGKMSLGGVYQCVTLEPPNPIAAGTFQVELIESPHFTAIMKHLASMQEIFKDIFPHGRFITPHLQNVPGHSYVEIHIGNFPRDTEDCTLVGETAGTDYIAESDQAFIALMMKLTKDAKLVIPQDPQQAAYYELSEPLVATYEDWMPQAD